MSRVFQLSVLGGATRGILPPGPKRFWPRRSIPTKDRPRTGTRRDQAGSQRNRQAGRADGALGCRPGLDTRASQFSHGAAGTLPVLRSRSLAAAIRGWRPIPALGWRVGSGGVQARGLAREVEVEAVGGPQEAVVAG